MNPVNPFAKYSHSDVIVVAHGTRRADGLKQGVWPDRAGPKLRQVVNPRGQGHDDRVDDVERDYVAFDIVIGRRVDRKPLPSAPSPRR